MRWLVSMDEALATAKGGYILIIKLNEERRIVIGCLGMLCFARGFYAYLGSALGGFKLRINRHLIKGKKPKWHIDYLLREAEISGIVLYETQRRLECLLSQTLVHEMAFIPGFGCSDCHCQSHLYFANDERSLTASMDKAVARLALPGEQIQLSFKEERS